MAATAIGNCNERCVILDETPCLEGLKPRAGYPERTREPGPQTGKPTLLWLLLGSAASRLRLGARIQGDVPAVGEIHARGPHEIGSVLSQKAVNRELLAALDHVL